MAFAVAATLLTTVPVLGAVAEAQSSDATASTGQDGSAEVSCSVGAGLLEAREYAEARKAYVEALSKTTKDSVRVCARKGIAKLDRAQAAADCERGDRYHGLSRDDDAIAAYKAALEVEPGLSCATQGLEKSGPSWPTRAVEWLEEWLVAVGLLLVAFFVLIQLGRLRLPRRLLLRIPGVGRLVSPRLSVEPMTDDAAKGKPGAPLGAMIKEAMRRVWDEVTSEEPSDYDLGHSSAREALAELASDDPAVKSALEKASALSEQTKLLGALLGLLYALLPIRRFALSGTLSPAESGARATLLLERDGKLEAATTLTAAATGKDPEAVDYVHLAPPAAVWTQYEVARLLAGRPVDPDVALSYVALREGTDQPPAAAVEKSRASFQKAILLHRRNWAAYMSLATVDSGAKDTYLRSLQTLEYGLREMRERYEGQAGGKPPLDQRPFLGDANYYRMGYTLAARLTNGGLDPAIRTVLAGRDAAAPTGAQVAEQLIDDADTMIAWYRHRDYWGRGTIWPGLKPTEKRLWVFLTDTVRPCLKVLLAAAMLESDPEVAKARIAEVRGMERAPAAQRGKLSFRTLYNLACFEASPRSPGGTTAINEAQAMEDLRAAIRAAPGARRAKLLDAARADRSLSLLRKNVEFERLQEMLGAATEPAAKAKRRRWCLFGKRVGPATS